MNIGHGIEGGTDTGLGAETDYYEKEIKNKREVI